MTRAMTDEQDAIDHEASAWLVRIEENGLDCDARRDFDAWLAADPRHETTYDEMRTTWSAILELNELGHLVTVPDPLPAGESIRTTSHRCRRGVSMAALGVVAAGLIAIIAIPGHLLWHGQRYTTKLAETRIVTLPDGSSVTLGAKSSIAVKFSDTERRVVLSGGEAFFDVVHNAARPLMVEAGSSIVKDIGTKFDVNLSDDGSVRVAVLEGLVQVSRTGITVKTQPQKLGAGQRAELTLATSVSTSGVATPAPDIVSLLAQAPGSWREGRLVFDNVRLADLVSDLNRYYGPGIKLASADVGDLRVTASFKTREIPAFMSALSATLRVTADAGGSFTVSGDHH